MYEGFELGSFMAGLPLGFLIAAIVLFFSWRKGKKERRYDERFHAIHNWARSFSWVATTIVILVAWAVVMIIEPVGTAFFVLMAVYMLHMISYIVGAAIASRRY
ncbi:hypothetical protein [Bhargavaea beijingensis]|uniref:DUF3796 domain-containing protein n=1 Tax=Bhargavaea beijingensis TaxID=426756 RepID=A0A1G7E0I4_9BACL|nr:hypothetical protein [Bhargavaea beijingensis]RSK25061.1 hypothetical protein EJA12_12720 [Bhargavaea beijingensis]SDE57233.1 hypothetical protein SAMN04488126_11213 [Bhargavaea beijingensis]